MKRLRFICLPLLFVVTPAFGFDPTGKYSYAEKGYSGEMTLSEGKVDENRLDALVAVRPLQVSIKTFSHSQGHTCDVEASENTAGRISSRSSISSVFMSNDDDSDMKAKFSIKFTPTGATIEVNDRGGYCGLNGYFGGKWVKVSSKKSKQYSTSQVDDKPKIESTNAMTIQESFKFIQELSRKYNAVNDILDPSFEQRFFANPFAYKNQILVISSALMNRMITEDMGEFEVLKIFRMRPPEVVSRFVVTGIEKKHYNPLAISTEAYLELERGIVRSQIIIIGKGIGVKEFNTMSGHIISVPVIELKAVCSIRFDQQVKMVEKMQCDY